MEQQIVDFAPSNMNGETTDLDNRETQMPDTNKPGHNAVSETIDAATRLTTAFAAATDPSQEIDDVIAHAAGDGYKFRNQLISETPGLSFEQRMKASFDNDLFLRDQENFEIEKRNTVRESKTKNKGNLALKVGGSVFLGGAGVGVGAWGISVLVKTIRGDDDDD